ncbi:MAG: patatin-like phospholipase family protein [Pseudomonadota bacterium]
MSGARLLRATIRASLLVLAGIGFLAIVVLFTTLIWIRQQSSATVPERKLPPGAHSQLQPGDGMIPEIADATSGPSADGKLNVLMISSGGQNTAYGAGVMSASFESGILPRFDTVTGVSGGSLMALQAFVGKTSREETREFVEQVAEAVSVTERRSPAFLELIRIALGKGTSVSGAIERVIANEISDQVVAGIAAEHEK